MNIIDIILLVILALCVLLAIKKGLLRSIVEFAGFLLALPVSIYGAKAVAPLLYNQFFHQRLIDSTVTKMDGYGDIAAFVAQVKGTLNALPFSLEGLGQKFGVDINGTLDGMTSGLSNATLAQEYVNSFLKPIVTVLCTGALILLFFILMVVAIKILSFVLKTVPMPHGLKEANGVLGAIMGLLKGVIVVFVLCTVLGMVQVGLSFKEAPTAFGTKISESFVVEKVNQFNPLFK